VGGVRGGGRRIQRSKRFSAASAVLRAFSSNYLTPLLHQFFLGLGLAAVLPCLPLIVKEWAANRTLGLFDLQISGHTHQGQILPFRIITRFFPLMTADLFIWRIILIYL